MNFQKYIICEFIAAGQHLAHSCKEWIFFCVGSLPYGITDCGVQKFSVPKSCSSLCIETLIETTIKGPRACKDIENERFWNKLPKYVAKCQVANYFKTMQKFNFKDFFPDHLLHILHIF